MRLINTATLIIHEFIDAGSAPAYAILSHCWGDSEVNFKDYVKGRVKDGPGYDKIADCCAFAEKRKIDWVCIDTCCIDKRSSAELSEAINSMYEWYEEAYECYAYLADVSSSASDKSALLRELRESRWFTRSWTLQELIAPETVVFVNDRWQEIGRKLYHPNDHDDSFFADALTTASGLPQELLRYHVPMSYFSAAQRLSWAARRKITRIEDMAYCMLGSFDINLPLLYGEGPMAFEGLQIEVLNRTGDESLFAWRRQLSVQGFRYYRSIDTLLATSIECFLHCGQIVRTKAHDRPSLIVSARACELQVSGQRPGVFYSTRDDVYAIRLDCADVDVTDRDQPPPCIIFVKKMQCSHFRKTYHGRRSGLEGNRGLTYLENDLEDLEYWFPVRDRNTMLMHLEGFEMACHEPASSDWVRYRLDDNKRKVDP